MTDGIVLILQLAERGKIFFIVWRRLKKAFTASLMVNCFGNVTDIADIR
jgi:hypothetical protein